MPSWIQDPKTGELIPKEEFVRHAGHTVMGDIEPFVSPIDGTIISSRSKLREHNKRHGVTNIRDYGDSWFQRKAQERTAELESRSDRCRRERIQTICDAIEKHGG